MINSLPLSDVINLASDNTEYDDEQPELMNLIAKTALRDRNAFELLYSKTSSRSYGLALRMLGSTDSAQDLLQEVYMQVWSNALEYRPDKGRALTWILAIVRYRALDLIRGNQRRSNNAVKHHHQQSLAKELEYTENSDGLLVCLDRLAGRQRENIVQAFYYGWTYQELSVREALPVGTIKSQIRRGLAKLKECLSK